MAKIGLCDLLLKNLEEADWQFKGSKQTEGLYIIKVEDKVMKLRH